MAHGVDAKCKQNHDNMQDRKVDWLIDWHLNR